MRFSLSITILSVLLLISCSVERRHYRNGYHFEWDKKAIPNTPQYVSASSQNEITLIDKYEDPAELFIKTDPKCDTIVLKDSVKIPATIRGVSLNNVRYQYCNYESQHDIVLSRKQVAYIKYNDGNKDFYRDQSNEEINEEKKFADYSKNKPNFIPLIALGVFLTVFATITSDILGIILGGLVLLLIISLAIYSAKNFKKGKSLLKELREQKNILYGTKTEYLRNYLY